MTNGSEVVEVESTTSAPILSATQTSASSVELSWNKVDGMKYYEVYSGTNETYRRIKVTTNTNTTVSRLKTGNTYNFKVRGYRALDDVYYHTSFSEVVSVTIQ